MSAPAKGRLAREVVDGVLSLDAGSPPRFSFDLLLETEKTPVGLRRVFSTGPNALRLDRVLRRADGTPFWRASSTFPTDLADSLNRPRLAGLVPGSEIRLRETDRARVPVDEVRLRVLDLVRFEVLDPSLGAASGGAVFETLEIRVEVVPS